MGDRGTAVLLSSFSGWPGDSAFERVPDVARGRHRRAWQLGEHDSSGQRASPCIAGHRDACICGVFVDDLIAVTERVCDQGWRQFFDEAAQGGVPCAAEVDTKGAELAHHGVGVDVLAGQGPGEEPPAALIASLLVGPVV